MRGRSIALLVCGAALAASLVAESSTAGAADRSLDFGTLVVAAKGQTLPQRLTQLENQIGRTYTDVRIFQKWDDAWPDGFATGAAAGGRRIILSVKAIKANGQRVTWSQVAAAQPGSDVDATMRRWATAMRDLGTPIRFAFDHEPEAGTGKGTAAEYQAAWRRFAQVIDEVGATNVELTWIMTANSFGVGPSDRRYAPKWYPGDDVVDVIASDAYNWYTCRGKATERWRSLEQVITPMRDFGRLHPTVQLVLTEFGSAEDPANPDRKAQWFRDATGLFQRPGWEQFTGVVYFNRRGQKECNWSFDSSPQAAAAYIAMAQDPFYAG
jgi:hypothetical protein